MASRPRATPAPESVKNRTPADTPALPRPVAAGPRRDETPSGDVLVGIVSGAWGVRGEVKVEPQSADAAALLNARRWRLDLDRGPATGPPSMHVDVRARRHGSGVVARIDGVADRDAAQALAGARIHVPRDAFPRTGTDEYYWIDLIGCAVVNRQGEALGDVVGLIDTGVHSVLRIGGEGLDERLVPFVAAYVDDVDLAARSIRVDWGLDY